MATTLSQEWLPNLRFIVKYSENQPFSAIFALPRVANVSLCGGKTRDGYAERRTGNVRKSDFVAEFHRRRIAAVFAADPARHSGPRLSAELHRHLHQFANADGIEARKRIGFVNLVCIVRGQEFSGVVAGEAESHLR